MIRSLAAVLLVLTLHARGQEIVLHEWGVVLYGSGTAVAAGAPPGEGIMPVLVDAPVIAFHGSGFSGDVFVCSFGDVFSVYPMPDSTGGLFGIDGLGSTLWWSDVTVSPPVVDVPVTDRRGSDDALIPGFGWAAGMWRSPEACWIERPSDGFRDKFLYYEVDLAEIGLPIPLEGRAPEGFPPEDLVTDMLVFTRCADGGVSCSRTCMTDSEAADESVPAPADDKSCETVMQAMRYWAGDLLAGDEIDAMWATWEPYVYRGDWQGDSLAVFPMPRRLVACISGIGVFTSPQVPVVIDRFFLGMLPL